MPRPDRSRFITAIAQWTTWFNLLMIALLWLGITHNLGVRREAEERAARLNVGNLSRIFAEHVARAVRESDKTLLLLRSALEASPEGFELHSWVGSVQFRSEMAVQYALIGADGIMLASNVGPANARVNLSDREHFKVHVDSDSDELFISKPVLGRQSGKWSIQLSRKIRGPEGKFAGVLVSSLDPYHLAKFYQSVDVGRDGAITLVGFDGIIRARGGMASDTLGQSMASSEVLKAYMTSPAGILMGSGVVDGVRRLVGYSVIDGYPLIVTAAMSQKELLSDYERDKFSYLIIGWLLTAVLLLLSVVSIRDRIRLGDTLKAKEREREKAEHASKVKSSFLAVMSHEIRTPLNAVLGLTSSLLTTPLQIEQRETLKTIHDAGDSLLEILNDILDYSKLEAGELSVETVAFAPAHITNSIVSIIGPRAKGKGLDLSVTMEADVPGGTLGDAGRVRQVLLNLVSNAVKFTQAGRVDIICRCKSRNDREVVLEWLVRDSGIGIAPDQIGRLFNDYVQADCSINRRFGGSGLGLSICKRIIDAMGGDIGVESALGRGTTMRFCIPFPLTELPALPDAESDDGVAREFGLLIASLGRPLRILIADDNSTNRLVVSRMLHDVDARITMAADGTEAVAADCSQFDVILMDVRMPEMDGLEATARIRAKGIDTPVIAFTANAFAEDVEKCNQAGMTDFLVKPARKAALLAVMHRVLKDRVKVAVSSRATTTADPSQSRAGDKFDSVPLFDKRIFDALASELGLEAMDEAFQAFIPEARKRLSALRVKNGDGERDVVGREAHTLKGTAATFGFLRMSEMAKQLERSAATIDPDAMASTIVMLEETFEQCLEAASCDLALAA